MTATSDSYELFVKQVVEALGGVEVHHKRCYTGRVSGREIEVDLSFETSVVGAKLLILLECKCYKSAVSAAEVEEFHSKLDDIGAHKGVMITTVGFQEGAVKVAEGRGIALALLTRESVPNELRFVALAEPPPGQRLVHNEGFFQGNLQGPQGRYRGGFRFEHGQQFLSVLFRDEFEEERLAVVARWKREHGEAE